MTEIHRGWQSGISAEYKTITNTRKYHIKRYFLETFEEEQMIADLIKLAKLWSKLFNLKEQLDDEIISVAGYLDFHDPELMIAFGIFP